MKFAAIDLGSNAIRLLISGVEKHFEHTRFKKLLLVRVPLRLGMDTFKAGEISQKKEDNLYKVLASFKNLMEVYEVDTYMGCATAALREARNGADVIDKINFHLGLNIRIIKGTQEAAILLNTHIAESIEERGNFVYIDVGGGSTELTIFSDNKIVESISFGIGTLKLLNGKVKDKDWTDLKSWIREMADNYEDLTAIGTGGNINKYYKLSGKKDKLLSYHELKMWHLQLAELTNSQRILQYDLHEDRADVIVPAGKIFLSIMKWGNIREIFVPKVGLVDGIIHYLYGKHKNTQNNN